MTNSHANKANITIPVDLTNPGQLFACCGLLELADRLRDETGSVTAFSKPSISSSRPTPLSGRQPDEGQRRSLWSVRSQAEPGNEKKKASEAGSDRDPREARGVSTQALTAEYQPPATAVNARL